MDYSFLKEETKRDYSFLQPKKNNNYDFLNRNYNPDEVEKADNYRKVTLPLALGGGEYMTNNKGDLYMTPRSQDAIGGALPGKERDHIIPVSLGGTSNLKNLQYLESKPSFWQRIKGLFGNKPTVQESPERQENKVKIERQTWQDYSDGKISLPQARLKIATKQQQIQGLTPTNKEQTVAGQFFPALKEEVGNLLKVPGNMAKDAGTAVIGSLDFIHRTGLHVVSGIGTLTSPAIVSASKLLGDDNLKNISYDKIWKDAMNSGTKRAIDIGRPDEYFKSQITGDTYRPNRLLLDEAEKIAKNANKNLKEGNSWEATGDIAKLAGIGFMRDWANPFYAIAVKDIVRNPYKPRGKVLWQKKLVPDKAITGKAPKVKPQTVVVDVKTEQQKIFEVLGDKTKGIKEPNVKMWIKMDKNGRVTADVRNLGGDILDKNLLKQVGDIKPGANTPILSLPATTKARIAPPIITKTPQTAGKLIINDLNPTGSIFKDYTPTQRANAKLGKNITTLDKTMDKPADELVTIYRGSNKGGNIVPGDFVTTNKQLAQDYAGTGQIIKKKVKLSDILDDTTEPLGEEYIYKPTPKPTKEEPLIAEAKKYNTFDEFVKAQGTPLYHGSTKKIKAFENKDGGIYFTKDASGAEKMAKMQQPMWKKEPIVLNQVVLDYKKPFVANEKNLKKLFKERITDQSDEFYNQRIEDYFDSISDVRRDTHFVIKDRGYDSIIITKDTAGLNKSIESIVVFNVNQIKTKSQLKDIWNKAQKPVSKTKSIKYKSLDKTTTSTKEPRYEPITEPKEKFDGKVIDTTSYKDETLSRHYERVKEQYGFTDNVEFTRKTEKAEKKKAFDFIQRNPDKALRAGYNLDEIPNSINSQVFRSSLVASLLAQNKVALAQEVAKIQSIKMTEAAQTLAFGRVDIGEQARIVQNITQQRLEKLGRSLGEKAPEKQVEVARKKVEIKAKNSAKDVVKNQKQAKDKALEQIDDLINDIIC
jgi:hypothetical protein